MVYGFLLPTWADLSFIALDWEKGLAGGNTVYWR